MGVNVRSSIGLTEINKVCGMQFKLERTPVPPALLFCWWWSSGSGAAGRLRSALPQLM